ncbi:hypothetical protein PanWU01x14_183390 [Parasponia andersonii]|uniref:Transmembrane protein n=1 Tax=Parasponia andersonii TaxID=3476 RepID=A0A2P5C4W7_PARAD|nr:hypothetical protein PanWU01x14_183390 [Parasponia andersonii]
MDLSFLCSLSHLVLSLSFLPGQEIEGLPRRSGGGILELTKLTNCRILTFLGLLGSVILVLSHLLHCRILPMLGLISSVVLGLLSLLNRRVFVLTKLLLPLLRLLRRVILHLLRLLRRRILRLLRLSQSGLLRLFRLIRRRILRLPRPLRRRRLVLLRLPRRLLLRLLRLLSGIILVLLRLSRGRVVGGAPVVSVVFAFSRQLLRRIAVFAFSRRLGTTFADDSFFGMLVTLMNRLQDGSNNTRLLLFLLLSLVRVRCRFLHLNTFFVFLLSVDLFEIGGRELRGCLGFLRLGLLRRRHCSDFFFSLSKHTDIRSQMVVVVVVSMKLLSLISSF